MKNILFGLMAVTSVAFAAAPSLGTDVSQGSAGTVFQTGQTGEIAVHGKLQANTEILKYVVYASLNGDYDPEAGEVWKLPTWTTEAFESVDSLINPGELAFGGKEVPKLYVRKVNGDSTNVLPLSTETVSYKLVLDPAFKLTQPEVVKDFSSTFAKTYLMIWSFMTKAQLVGKVETYSTNSYDDARVWFKKIGTSYSYYYAGGNIFLERESLGVLKLYHDKFLHGLTFGFNLEWAQAIDRVLATEQTGNPDLAILVKVQ